VLVELLGNPHFKNEGADCLRSGLSNDGSQTAVDRFHRLLQRLTQPGNDRARPRHFFENTPPPPHLVVPLTNLNLLHGETQGIEVAVNWQPIRRWTLSPGYALEEIHMHLAPTSQDTTSVGQAQGSSPEHSAQLRSHFEPAHGPGLGRIGVLRRPPHKSVEACVSRLDTGLSWQFAERASLGIFGQDLLRTPMKNPSIPPVA